MNALDLLAYQTKKQLDSFFEAVHRIPADKVDWQPSAGMRSALDQLQEVAVVFQGIPDAITKRKLEFTPEQFAQYDADRKKVTDVAELERMTRDGTERLLEFMKTIKPEELMDAVEMPWPGDFRVADLLNYHNWNMSYHEGQINYIGGLLEIPQ
jgi:uncharacterized damage-inducible protein DinB